ncbi:hypothetical protein F0562_029103 [Nyssa sinensis]|uniref:Uncharacterized protein n=1 Tax=Nyssa sinensis TaxID=561372 RepID=A0A5J5B044_9ASTE|nr:hypothetical protein F0562_029103 [Nyssa sinensis]
MGTTRVLSIQSSSELAPQEVAKTCLQRWQKCTSRAEPESPSRARQSLRLKRWQRHASRGGRDVPPELSQNLHPELVRACASRGGKDMPPEVAEMYLQRWQSQASRASIASRDGGAKPSEVGLQRASIASRDGGAKPSEVGLQR